MTGYGTRLACYPCAATGVYVGAAEKPGDGVICVECEGKGYLIVNSDGTVFTELQKRDDVETVMISLGTFLGPDVDGDSVTYAEFVSGKLPDGKRLNRYSLQDSAS